MTSHPVYSRTGCKPAVTAFFIAHGKLVCILWIVRFYATRWPKSGLGKTWTFKKTENYFRTRFRSIFSSEEYHVSSQIDPLWRFYFFGLWHHFANYSAWYQHCHPENMMRKVNWLPNSDKCWTNQPEKQFSWLSGNIGSRPEVNTYIKSIIQNPQVKLTKQ